LCEHRAGIQLLLRPVEGNVFGSESVTFDPKTIVNGLSVGHRLSR